MKDKNTGKENVKDVDVHKIITTSFNVELNRFISNFEPRKAYFETIIKSFRVTYLGGMNMQTQGKGKPVTVAFILSIVSGILIVSQGTLRFIRNQWGLELGIGELRRSVVHGSGFRIISIVTVFLGIIVLFGALLMRNGRTRDGGITVIAFSALSIMSGGGYLAGLILGVVGGALAISEQLPSNSTKEPLPES